MKRKSLPSSTSGTPNLKATRRVGAHSEGLRASARSDASETPPAAPHGDVAEWRPVKWSPEWYEVSSDGRVRSWLGRGRSGSRGSRPKELKLRTDQNGYRWVGICVGPGAQRWYHVHRMVGEAFIGPLPDGMQTCHGDGDKTNNRVQNLRYGTPQENSRDRVRHGSSAGERNANSKLTTGEVEEIRRTYALGGITQVELGRRYGVTGVLIGMIVRRQIWNREEQHEG